MLLSRLQESGQHRRRAKFLAVITTCFGVTVAAPYQVTSAERPTEVRAVRPGVYLTITYGENGRVCKLQIPQGVTTKQETEAILDGMVPISARGKKWSEVENMAGVGGSATTYYEHVIITEQIFAPLVINKKPGASVTFKDKECGWKAGRDPFDKPSSAAAKSDAN